MWDKRHDMQVVVERTFEEIVANPYGIFTNDISYILLLELRNQRGLEPLAADIGKVFGEYNG
jgi:hypothetical protein